MKFLRFVAGQSGRARWILAAAAAIGIFSGVLSVGLVALINAALNAEGPKMAAIGWTFAALCALITLTRVTSVVLLANLGQGVVRELRVDLSRQISAAPLRRIEELGPNRLLATLTDDINAISQALIFVPPICLNGSIIAGCLIYLGFLDQGLLGMLLVAMLIGIVTYFVPAQLGMRKFHAAREQQDHLFGYFEGLIRGGKELRLHRPRRRVFGRLLAGVADLARKLRVKAALIYSAAEAWGRLLIFVVIGVLLFARPDFLGADRAVLTGFTLVLLFLMGPLQALLDSIPALGMAEVSAQKVASLGFSLDGAAGGAPRPPAVPARSWQRIEFRGVTHTYHREGQDHPFELGPIDLTLEPGELVFLVGGNGSGKTTLAKVFVGLYAPERGEILLDGQPVTETDRDDFRQLFSVVFSDFYLFDRLLGLEAPDLDQQAGRYLRELQIDHKVEIRDGQLSATDLSQGQRKRLALLTAYLEDRQIYVFDEWAADQDPVFKEVFYRRVLPDLKARGKTVLAISHDDRYFHLADRLVKLEDGRLRFSGTSHELPESQPQPALGSSLSR
ncbi:MAG: cyclic peptide export ABC transporter [Acidobacteriota bacterium]